MYDLVTEQVKNHSYSDTYDFSCCKEEEAPGPQGASGAGPEAFASQSSTTAEPPAYEPEKRTSTVRTALNNAAHASGRAPPEEVTRSAALRQGSGPADPPPAGAQARGGPWTKFPMSRVPSGREEAGPGPSTPRAQAGLEGEEGKEGGSKVREIDDLSLIHI